VRPFDIETRFVRADEILSAKGVRHAMLRTESRDWNRLATIVSLSLVLAVLPACSASAGHGFFRRPQGDALVVTPPAATQPYVAYRPVYPLPGTKPLYLSNYAGSNYPSIAPGAALTPTDFRVLMGRPVPVRPANRWGGFGAGW
jgi:hypothetical protein